jgi:hypothetical protein
MKIDTMTFQVRTKGKLILGYFSKTKINYIQTMVTLL